MISNETRRILLRDYVRSRWSLAGVIWLFVALLYFFAAYAHGQDYEYGKLDELKGKRTYMVETYGEVKVRQGIIDRIAAELPELELVEEVTKADIKITYSPYNGDSRGWGVGVVAIDAMGNDKARPRILLNFEPAHRGTVFDKKTHIRFANEFIKAFLRANGRR